MRKLVSRAQLEAHVASKESSRFAINGIRFNGAGAVSTDGRMLLVVPYPEDSDLLCDFPASQDRHGVADDSSTTIPLAMATKAARNLPRGTVRGAAAAMLESADGAGGGVSITTTSEETSDVVRAKPTEAAFPDYDRVLRDEPSVELMFGVEPLIKLLGALKKAGADNVRLRLDAATLADHSGLQFAAEEIGRDEPVATGVLMPVVDDSERTRAVAHRENARLALTHALASLEGKR